MTSAFARGAVPRQGRSEPTRYGCAPERYIPLIIPCLAAQVRSMVTPALSEPRSGAPVNLLPTGLPVLPEELLSANLFSGQDPRRERNLR